jgi:hypothetical protein
VLRKFYLENRKGRGNLESTEEAGRLILKLIFMKLGVRV